MVLGERPSLNLRVQDAGLTAQAGGLIREGRRSAPFVFCGGLRSGCRSCDVGLSVASEHALLRHLTTGLAFVALAACVGAGAAHAQDANSGFLRDYSRLKAEKDAAGIERRVWVSPGFSAEPIRRVILERVEFHPAPGATEQVPAQALDEIRDYLDASLRRAVGDVLPLTERPGPDVVRIRVGVTATAVQPGLKPYQLIPVALVFTAVKAAAGKTVHEARLAVETEITDSATGETLVQMVRDAIGVELKPGEQLSLPMLKPRIDDWAQSVRQSLAARMGASR